MQVNRTRDEKCRLVLFVLCMENLPGCAVRGSLPPVRDWRESLLTRRLWILPVLLLGAGRFAQASPARSVPIVSAKAAVLMEARTGQILWAKNPHLRLPPASTTKIMTALLALEHLSPSKVIAVSEEASATDGSSIWLEPGERRTARELIYGAMLNSGNDACVALAEAVSGSEARFAALMNARARALGADETNFVNANGLPARGHLTSARDLALIAREALANPAFAAVSRTKVLNIPWPGKDWDRRLINHNKLLWRYDGADGVKTGYTRESGHCLVASATRGGRRLIAVVLNSRSMYDETGKMLDYGFEAFELVEVRRPGTAKIIGGRSPSVPLSPVGILAWAVPREEAERVRFLARVPGRVRAPVAEGQELGWAALQLGERMLCRVPLAAARAVETRNLFWSIASFVWRFFA